MPRIHQGRSSNISSSKRKGKQQQQQQQHRSSGSYRGGCSRGAALTATATSRQKKKNDAVDVTDLVIASPPPHVGIGMTCDDHILSLSLDEQHEQVRQRDELEIAPVTPSPVHDGGASIDFEASATSSEALDIERVTRKKKGQSKPKQKDGSPCLTRRRRRLKSNTPPSKSSHSSGQQQYQQFSLMHFESSHESTQRLLRTGVGQKGDNENIYAPDFMEGYENVLSSLEIIDTEFSHPKELIGTSSRIMLESQSNAMELVIYNDASYLTFTSKIWWRDNIPNKTLCSYRIIESLKASTDEPSKKYEGGNYSHEMVCNDERIWFAFPKLCREAHLLLTLHQRLIKSKSERVTIIPDQILVGKREASLQLKTGQYRLSTASQFLSFAVATGGMDLRKQETMADLIYQIIFAVLDCHSSQIVHGNLDLECVLLKEQSRTTCSVSLIGFSNAGIDCSKLKDTGGVYVADNHALAGMIYLLLTGNQLRKLYEKDRIEISQYIIGKPTYEAIINELLRPEGLALHMNDDLQCFLNILSTLRHDSEELVNVPELIEQPYVREKKRRRRSESICCTGEYYGEAQLTSSNDEARSLINDLQNESSTLFEECETDIGSLVFTLKDTNQD